MVRQSQLRLSLNERCALQFGPVVAQDDFTRGRVRRQVDQADLPRLVARRGRILGAAVLQAEIEEGDESQVDRPGGLLAIEAKGADKKPSWQLAPLKEE